MVSKNTNVTIVIDNWLAIDLDSKEIVGAYVGHRDKQSTQGLWDSLPPVYRQCAVAYTDFWDSYAAVFPAKRHRPVAKGSAKTNHIERFNLVVSVAEPMYDATTNITPCS